MRAGKRGYDRRMSRTLPPQHQERQPGRQALLDPQPRVDRDEILGSEKLRDKVVLITGGDSGIGRAVAVRCAKEGATVAIAYLDEDDDAAQTRRLVENYGARFFSIAGDVGDEETCKRIVGETVERFGEIHLLVNDAGEQHPQDRLEDVSAAQLERTFRTNVFSQFFMTKAALPHMKSGASIVNIASITAYEGNARLLDYSATKGAIVSLTRSLSLALVERGIRVNAVAPGPIWTPLIASSYDAEHVSKFGADTPMKRPGQPDEVAAAVVFLASEDATYISGQTIHVNGGTVING